MDTCLAREVAPQTCQYELQNNRYKVTNAAAKTAYILSWYNGILWHNRPKHRIKTDLWSKTYDQRLITSVCGILFALTPEAVASLSWEDLAAEVSKLSVDEFAARLQELSQDARDKLLKAQ